MFAVPAEDYIVDPIMAEALRLLLILHADHEQNCSTSTVRMVGSSRANLFISIAAGIGALWGALHGGANQQVIEMLKMINADGGNFEKYVETMRIGITAGFGVIRRYQTVCPPSCRSPLYSRDDLRSRSTLRENVG